MVGQKPSIHSPDIYRLYLYCGWILKIQHEMHIIFITFMKPSNVVLGDLGEGGVTLKSTQKAVLQTHGGLWWIIRPKIQDTGARWIRGHQGELPVLSGTWLRTKIMCPDSVKLHIPLNIQLCIYTLLLIWLLVSLFPLSLFCFLIPRGGSGSISGCIRYSQDYRRAAMFMLLWSQSSNNNKHPVQEYDHLSPMTANTADTVSLSLVQWQQITKHLLYFHFLDCWEIQKAENFLHTVFIWTG